MDELVSKNAPCFAFPRNPHPSPLPEYLGREQTAPSRAWRCATLRQHGRDDFAVDVRQTIVSTRMAERQLGVVDAHDAQDRGVQVVDGDGVFDGVVAVVVG